MSDAAIMPSAPLQGRRIHIQSVVNFFFVVFVLCGAIAFVEPSPYDFASLIAIPVWFIAGFRMHWSFIPFAMMLLVYNFAGFLALVPYWNETGPAMFMFQSFYLLVTVLFFALFFGERTTERAELCLKAFTASNMIAALAGSTLVVDCTVEGLMHASELPAILQGVGGQQPRIVYVSNEHPEALVRLLPDEATEARVKDHVKRLRAARTMHVTSAAGTDLSIALQGAHGKAVVGGNWGSTTRPGTLTHWPGGLALALRGSTRSCTRRSPLRWPR